MSAKFPKFIKFSILPNILSGEIATILGSSREKVENFAFCILHSEFFILPLHRIIAIKYLINKKHIQDEKGNSSRELSFGGIQGYVE